MKTYFFSLFFVFILVASPALASNPGLPIQAFFPFSTVETVYDCGDSLYLGVGERVLVFNANENTFEYQGFFSVQARITSIRANENKLFVATEGRGLYVFARDNIGGFPSEHWLEAREIYHIELDEENIILSAGMDGLYYLELEDLEEEFHVQAHSSIWKTLYKENTLYIIDGFASTSIHVVDLQTPDPDIERVIVDLELDEEEPQDEVILPEDIEDLDEEYYITEKRHLATINRGNQIKDIALDQDVLFVADGEGGLVLYDVSNPIHIEFIKAFSPEEWDEENIFGVRAKNDRVIATGKKGLYFLKEKETVHFKPFSTNFTNNLGPEPEFLDLKNNRFVISSQLDGLLVYDLGEFSSPQKIAEIPIPQDIRSILMEENRAFIASGLETIWELNLTGNPEPNFPENMQHIQVPGMPLDMKKNNGLLLVASGIGIGIVDISSPGSPEIKSFQPFPYPDNYPDYNKGWVEQIIVKDKVVYAACGPGGVWILDISSPSSPTTLVNFSFGEEVTNFSIDENRNILFAKGSSKVGIFNITEPNNPILLSELEMDFDPTGIASKENHLYIGQKAPSSEEKGSIQIFDISNPFSPNSIRSIDFDHQGPEDIFIRGNYLLSSSRSEGIKIFSLLSPTNLRPELELELSRWKAINYNDPLLSIASEEGLFFLEFRPR